MGIRQGGAGPSGRRAGAAHGTTLLTGHTVHDGGGTFEQTFDEAGEFAYHCNIHPQMTGTVSVSD